MRSCRREEHRASPLFPPSGGISSIKMGITNKIGGRPSPKEVRGAKPEKKCGTCEDAVKIMLCTDKPDKPDKQKKD